MKSVTLSLDVERAKYLVFEKSWVNGAPVLERRGSLFDEPC